MMSAADALQRLKEGNARHVSGAVVAAHPGPAQRGALVAGQSPFAAVLGCADSRVPVEMVFDQGPGALFVVRVAGNVAATTGIGSIEYAAEQLGVRLVVVLGHSHCGAVQATLQWLRPSTNPPSPPNPPDAAHPSPNLSQVLQEIRPAAEGVLAEGVVAEGAVAEGVANNGGTETETKTKTGAGGDNDNNNDNNNGQTLDRAVRANIRQTVAALRARSGIIDGTDGLQVIGGLYHLGDGTVEFLE